MPDGDKQHAARLRLDSLFGGLASRTLLRGEVRGYLGREIIPGGQGQRRSEWIIHGRIEEIRATGRGSKTGVAQCRFKCRPQPVTRRWRHRPPRLKHHRRPLAGAYPELVGTRDDHASLRAQRAAHFGENRCWSFKERIRRHTPDEIECGPRQGEGMGICGNPSVMSVTRALGDRAINAEHLTARMDMLRQPCRLEARPTAQIECRMHRCWANEM